MHPYEDGYNLSMLEAMATGMPVLSLANPTSPITDGEDGFISDDIQQLRRSAKLLLDDVNLAKTVGAKARTTVETKFPISFFVARWEKAIASASAGRKKIPAVVARPGPEKKANVWMDYTYYPATTAHYLRRAYEGKHHVATSGPSLPPELITAWKLENMKAPVLPQDVPRTAAGDAVSIQSKLPGGFAPDFFLWVETGLSLPPDGLEKLAIPKAAYLIDTHLHLDMHVQLAKMFDVVFLAHRDYVQKLKDAGIKHVYWLPVGCDPEIHGKRDVAKIHEIGFAGTISDNHPRRSALLEKLRAKFDVHAERVFLGDMAEMYSASKIVFNNAIRYDLNMRVFEALCSGTMLLTDDAEALRELFEDGRHLVIYNDAEIAEKADYYLKHEEKRERIAAAGRELVLQKHTYLHRAEEIIQRIEDLFGPLKSSKGTSVAPGVSAGYFQNERTDVAELVPQNAQKILEIGCAAGGTGKLLKRGNPEREVVGLEYDKKSALEAEKHLDRVFCGDAERFRFPYPEKYFDCIVYADVLEHLRDPGAVLKRHKKLLSQNGTVVMSIPNVRHVSVVNGLAEGRWTYQDEGLLDRTHLRFFTLSEIKDLLETTGFDVVSITGKRVDNIYKEGDKGTLNLGRWRMDALTEQEMFEFFVFQYLIIATPKDAPEQEEDPSHPARYRRLVLSEFPNLKTDEDFLRLAKANAVQRPLLAGHCNMAVGQFSQAHDIYKKAGNTNFMACASAGKGLMLDALKELSSGTRDSQTAELFETFRHGPYSPETAALTAFGPEQGGAEHPGQTAICRMEREDDPAGALIALRNALSPGGLLAVYFISGDAESAYPAPLHVFSGEGIKKLIGLVGGFGDVTVMELLPGVSGLALCQKGQSSAIDFAGLLNKRFANIAHKKSEKYWDEGFFEASAQSARAALALDKKNHAALSKLGDCLLQTGDLAGAENYYKGAISAGGVSSAPHMGLGTISLIKGDLNKAKAYFEKAVTTSPENPEALAGLGTALSNLGKVAEGLALCKKAALIDPESGVALNALVQAYAHSGDFASAEGELNRYLELHPANTDVLYTLAVVQTNGGKKDDARETLDKLLMFAQDHKEAKALLKELGRK
jgi:tetratricopeptide (TPR) repeat protein/glycosyltransferase involved in cell wall biosynthesis/ubiquinone/menaquinone biosynthesis C-methylase UbiE